jgi:hypothetical protein
MLDIVNAPAPEPWSHDGIYTRLIQQIPESWWGSLHPNTDLVLEGFITTAGLNYDQFNYVFLQLRLQTATGNNLDLISQDYFGGTLPRKTGENDDSFRNRISATLLQEKTTRYGMQNALFLLTGIEPTIFEPWNYYDCGAYNVPSSLAYNTVGSYGSGAYPGQVFIDVYVNAFDAMGNYSGYNDYYGGYNTAGNGATLWYGNDSLIQEVVSDSDIYQTINITKPEGILCWVAIHRIDV